MIRIYFIIIAILCPLLVNAQTPEHNLQVVLNQAQTYFANGDMKQTVDFVKSNKDVFYKVGDGKWAYHMMLGTCYASLLQNERSESEFKLIVTGKEMNVPEKEKAIAYCGIASACLGQGKMQQAEEAYMNAYQMLHTLGLDDDVCMRRVEAGLGTVYYFFKNYEEAANHFANAKFLHEKNLDFGLEYVKCLSNYALVLEEQNNLFWAKCMIDVARNSLFQETSISDMNTAVMMLASMSTIYADMGYMDESMDIIEKGIGLCNEKMSSQKALLYNNLAVHSMVRKEYGEAVVFFKKALSLSGKTNLDEILFNLAYAQWLAKDEDYGKTAVKMSKGIIGDVTSKFSFLSNAEREKYWNYYSPYLYVLNSWLVKSSNKQNTEYLYNNALFAKGLLLRAANRVKEQIENSSNMNLKKKYTEMLELQDILDKSSLSEDSLSEITLQKDRLDKELVKLVQGYVSVKDVLKEYDWKNIQKELGPKDCAIEFVMIPTWNNDSINSDFTYYALLLKADSENPTMVELGKNSELKSIIGKSKSLPLHRYITNLYKNGGARNQGKKLYDFIWKPLEGHLAGSQNIYYSPIGVLNTISFNAISRDTIPIGRLYNMYQLTSTSQIQSLKKSDDKLKVSSALVYGGVLYDADEKELIAASRSFEKKEYMVWKDTEKTDKSTRSGWGYLPGTKFEANTICEKLDSIHIRTQLMTGCKANEESFKNIAHSYDLIHVATHGFFLVDSKEIALNTFLQGQRSTESSVNAMVRSGLLLAGANRGWTGLHTISNIEDSILTAAEISNLNLSSTKMVVLSACETGLGEIQNNEGVFGLQRAFKLAGVQSLIMSLWKVDDKATMLLMNTFYTNWIGGMKKHEAFNKAINVIRQKYKSPYYWAAFVMLD